MGWSRCFFNRHSDSSQSRYLSVLISLPLVPRQLVSCSFEVPAMASTEINPGIDRTDTRQAAAHRGRPTEDSHEANSRTACPVLAICTGPFLWPGPTARLCGSTRTTSLARYHCRITWVYILDQPLQCGVHPARCGLAVHVHDQNELDQTEQSLLAHMMPELVRFVGLDRPDRPGALEELLLNLPREITDTDNDIIERELWKRYADVKLEFAYRTLWAPRFGLSNRVQEIVVDLAEKLLNGIGRRPPLAATRDEAVKLALNIYVGAECLREQNPGPIAHYLNKEARRLPGVPELVPLNVWMNAPLLAAQIQWANPVDLDGTHEDGIRLALLPHGRRGTFVRLTTALGHAAAPDNEVIVPDLSHIPEAAMLGSLPIDVRTISMTEAQDILNAPDKAGWLALMFA